MPEDDALFVLFGQLLAGQGAHGVDGVYALLCGVASQPIEHVQRDPRSMKTSGAVDDDFCLHGVRGEHGLTPVEDRLEVLRVFGGGHLFARQWEIYPLSCGGQMEVVVSFIFALEAHNVTDAFFLPTIELLLARRASGAQKVGPPGYPVAAIEWVFMCLKDHGLCRCFRRVSKLVRCGIVFP